MSGRVVTDTVNMQFFVSLHKVVRETDDRGDWIVFHFTEGGTVRVPIHADHVCVWSEPERH